MGGVGHRCDKSGLEWAQVGDCCGHGNELSWFDKERWISRVDEELVAAQGRLCFLDLFRWL